jgi:uncharacterized membrane protein
MNASMVRANKPPAPRRGAPTINASTITSQQYTAIEVYDDVLPPPATLQAFDAISPGAAQRIIDVALGEALHRRALESQAMQANIATQQAQTAHASAQLRSSHAIDLLGKAAGLLLSVCCIGGAIWLATNGSTAVAIALIALPTAAVLKAFMSSKAK